MLSLFAEGGREVCLESELHDSDNYIQRQKLKLKKKKKRIIDDEP